MTVEQAKYHLSYLPMRQAMLRAMLREPHHTVEGIRIIRKELQDNRATLAKAQEITK